MDKIFEKKFKEMVAKDCNKMNFEFAVKWAELSLYLENENDEGKNEFRIHINSDKSFYIHPINKDGKTFDATL